MAGRNVFTVAGQPWANLGQTLQYFHGCRCLIYSNVDSPIAHIWLVILGTKRCNEQCLIKFCLHATGSEASSASYVPDRRDDKMIKQ